MKWHGELEVALGDIWELTLRSTFQLQQCLNVFYYEETTEETVLNPEDAISLYFLQDMIPLLQAVISTQVVYDAGDVAQITGGVAIGSRTYGVAGLTATDSLPSFVTFSFRYNRASAASRHGYKRFSGVTEDAQIDGALAAAYTTPIATLAAALIIPLTDSVGSGNGAFTPRIVSKTINGQPRPTPLAFPVASVEFIGITSQNTRKV